MIEKIDHIAIAVRNLNQIKTIFEDIFDLKHRLVEIHSERKLKVCFIPVGEVMVELLEPTSPDGNIAKFIEEKGEGLHHIALRVEDIGETILELEKRGMKLRDRKPRLGAGGSKISFIDPDSTHSILIELVERKKDF